MVNGKWLPDFIERLKASAWHQLYLPLFTHARSESINADSLKLQLLTARKKEWWPAKVRRRSLRTESWRIHLDRIIVN